MIEYKENYRYITRQHELNEVLEWARMQKYVCFDIETGPQKKYIPEWQENNKIGLDPYKAEIVTFQIGNRYNQYIVDNRSGLNVSGVVDILEDPEIGILGVNLRFDTKFIMHHWGCRPTRLLDAMIMEQILRAGLFMIDSSNEKKSMVVRRYSGMKSLAERYLNKEIDKDKELRIGLWKTPIGEFDHRQLSYMAGDCIYPDLIAKQQKPLLQERDLLRVVQLEHELIPVVANMELQGVPFNRSYWLHLLQEAKERLSGYEKILDKFFEQTVTLQEDLFGQSSESHRYDYGSTQQMAKALTDIGIPGFQTNKGKWTSTSSDKIKLMKVGGKIDPLLADSIFNYRTEKKKVESYGTNFLESVHDTTGRIQPDFTQTCLVTGRMSCSPGLQTIPKDSVYRQAFNTPEGYSLIILDASQIEARISADTTNDKPAIKVFQEGKDIYKEDGEKFFNKTIIRGTPEGEKLRMNAKAAWFGLTYGQGKRNFNRYCRLFLGEDVSREDTDFLFDAFFRIHFAMKESMDEWSRSADPMSPNDYFTDSLAKTLINPIKAREVLLKIYMNQVHEEKAHRIVNTLMSRVDKVTYTSTKLGRKRFYRSDFIGWWTAARNHPIQGLASDIQKDTLLQFQKYHWDEGIDAHVINVVHDEIITLARDEDVKELYENQIRIGTEVGQKYLEHVPMKLEGGISKVWKKF